MRGGVAWVPPTGGPLCRLCALTDPMATPKTHLKPRFLSEPPDFFVEGVGENWCFGAVPIERSNQLVYL